MQARGCRYFFLTPYYPLSHLTWSGFNTRTVAVGATYGLSVVSHVHIMKGNEDISCE
jgi:hypothetical protein